jgi:hypothetical protein
MARKTSKSLYKHICKYCGKEFENIYEEADYCSRKCYHASRILPEDQLSRPRSKTIPIPKEPNSFCPMCRKYHYREDAGSYTFCYRCLAAIEKQGIVDTISQEHHCRR